jgi:hypothetical protein
MRVASPDQIETLLDGNANSGCLPEADMALTQNERDEITHIHTDLAEIRETLRWHARIGWGAIGVFAVIATGFLTWYLPKELTEQKTEIVQGVALEIGKVPAGVLNNLIIPNDKLPSAPTSELQDRFEKIKNVSQTAIAGGLISNPQTLHPVSTFLRTSLTIRDDLPQSIRQQGASALVDVSGYSVFSQDRIEKQARLIFDHNLVEGDAKVWPTSEWLKIPPSEAQDVVASNMLFRNMRQNITGIRWLSTVFDHSVILYDGGDLYLSSTTFKDCTFSFGNDTTSRSVQKALEAHNGKPVTLLVTKDISFIPSASSETE